MLEDKDRKEYEEGLRDRHKGFIDQVVTDMSGDHSDSEAYYKGRSGEQLDEDKEDDES